MTQIYFVLLDASGRVLDNYVYNTMPTNPPAGCVQVFDESFVGDYFVGGVHYPNPVADTGHYSREFYTLVEVEGVYVWQVDQEEFTPYLYDAVANHRWNAVNELTATITADTYKKVGSTFEVDEEDVELELRLDANTEASLFTKAHVTPNSPNPVSHERYKFVNRNVVVAREVFARALVAIDEKRQPYFEAEGAVIDAHEERDPITNERVNPFTRVQDALDAFDGYVAQGD